MGSAQPGALPAATTVRPTASVAKCVDLVWVLVIVNCFGGFSDTPQSACGSALQLGMNQTQLSGIDRAISLS